MTTMNLDDISHKKRVPSHYAPNSYRIFTEEISNQSIPDQAKYSNDAPSIYSHPTILPAQAIEDRNRPHGGRAAAFLRENSRTLNDPVAVINGHVGANNKDGDKWWLWSGHGAQDDDPNWKQKKRSQSSANLTLGNDGGDYKSGFQTTYQKEHGYLTQDFYRNRNNLNTVNGAVNRHSNNPNTLQSTGIVPVTDYKNYAPDNQERILVDKMSFEHQYDSRDADNYPNRGKRQGAFVIEQLEPKPKLGTKVYQDGNKGTSVWDCMHPIEDVHGNPPPKAQVYQKPFSGTASANERNQRRDPIGYFEDTKYSDYRQPSNNGEQMRPNSKYTPSWTNEPPANGNPYMMNNMPNGPLNGYSSNYNGVNSDFINAMNANQIAANI